MEAGYLCVHSRVSDESSPRNVCTRDSSACSCLVHSGLRRARDSRIVNHPRACAIVCICVCISICNDARATNTEAAPRRAPPAFAVRSGFLVTSVLKHVCARNP